MSRSSGRLASPSSNGEVTYAEARRVARWLNAFTARGLAEALHVHHEVGERFIRAMLWKGHVGGPVIEDTGVDLNGPEGPERLYEILPLPPWKPRPRQLAVEIRTVLDNGGFILYDPRGLPVGGTRGVSRTAARQNRSVVGRTKKRSQ